MAFLDETGLTRLWGKIEGKFSQFSGNIENTIDAIENTYTKPYTDGNLTLYVSKQGSDDNDGLTPETPLLTLDKAFEITNRKLPSSVNSYLELCVGPGEWGDFVIMQKPYIIKLFAYTFTNYITNIADIDQLPHFTSFNVRSSIQIYNANIDLLIVYDNSYCYFGNGLIVIGQAQAKYGSIIYIGGSTVPLYIKNVNQNHIFYAEFDGTISFCINSRQLTIYDNLNIPDGFFRVYRQGKIIGLSKTMTINVPSGVTVTGLKAIVTVGGVLCNYDPNIFPGTIEPSYDMGAIINGVTVGDTTHPGNKTFVNDVIVNNSNDVSTTTSTTRLIIKDPLSTKGVEHDKTTYTQLLFLDSTGEPENSSSGRLGCIEVKNPPEANASEIALLCYKNDNTNSSIAIRIGYDTTGTGYIKLGTTTVGSGTKPIYLNAGAPTAFTATVGSASKPVWLNAGAITVCSATVGSASKPVYMNAGALTALSATVGSASKPVYLNAGTLTALSATVGGTAKPVYLNAGTLTAITATVGSTARPVYLNAGTITVGLTHFTACSATAAGTAGPVTAPAKGKQAQFLRGDATWAAPSTGSDRRVKQDFSSIPDEVLEAWENIKYKQFKLKEEVSEKGNDALYHTGLVVQDIQEVFEEKQLDANKYNMIIHEVWPAHDDEYDEEGNLISPKDDGYEQYFMHYEEALSIEAAYLRKQVKLLKEKVDNLEKQISTISSKIS